MFSCLPPSHPASPGRGTHTVHGALFCLWPSHSLCRPLPRAPGCRDLSEPGWGLPERRPRTEICPPNKEVKSNVYHSQQPTYNDSYRISKLNLISLQNEMMINTFVCQRINWVIAECVVHEFIWQSYLSFLIQFDTNSTSTAFPFHYGAWPPPPSISDWVSSCIVFPFVNFKSPLLVGKIQIPPIA